MYKQYFPPALKTTNNGLFSNSSIRDTPGSDSILAHGAVGNLHTQKGIDIAYLSNDTEPVTQFNEAVRNYRTIKLGMAVTF